VLPFVETSGLHALGRPCHLQAVSLLLRLQQMATLQPGVSRVTQRESQFRVPFEHSQPIAYQLPDERCRHTLDRRRQVLTRHSKDVLLSCRVHLLRERASSGGRLQVLAP
jgi:hypothetical protein